MVGLVYVLGKSTKYTLYGVHLTVLRTPYHIDIKLKSREKEEKKKKEKKKKEIILRRISCKVNARPRYESSTLPSAFPLKGWRRASVRLGISHDRGRQLAKPL